MHHLLNLLFLSPNGLLILCVCINLLFHDHTLSLASFSQSSKEFIFGTLQDYFRKLEILNIFHLDQELVIRNSLEFLIKNILTFIQHWLSALSTLPADCDINNIKFVLLFLQFFNFKEISYSFFK